jgi:hypothetical protein
MVKEVPTIHYIEFLCPPCMHIVSLNNVRLYTFEVLKSDANFYGDHSS